MAASFQNPGSGNWQQASRNLPNPPVGNPNEAARPRGRGHSRLTIPAIPASYGYAPPWPLPPPTRTTSTPHPATTWNPAHPDQPLPPWPENWPLPDPDDTTADYILVNGKLIRLAATLTRYLIVNGRLWTRSQTNQHHAPDPEPTTGTTTTTKTSPAPAPPTAARPLASGDRTADLPPTGTKPQGQTGHAAASASSSPEPASSKRPAAQQPAPDDTGSPASGGPQLDVLLEEFRKLVKDLRHRLPAPALAPSQLPRTVADAGDARVLDAAWQLMAGIRSQLEELDGIAGTITPDAWLVRQVYGDAPLRDPFLSLQEMKELAAGLQQVTELAGRLGQQYLRIFETYERGLAAYRREVAWPNLDPQALPLTDALIKRIGEVRTRITSALAAADRGGSLRGVLRVESTGPVYVYTEIQNLIRDLDPALIAAESQLPDPGTITRKPQRLIALLDSIGQLQQELEELTDGAQFLNSGPARIAASDPFGDTRRLAGFRRAVGSTLSLAQKIATDRTPPGDLVGKLEPQLRNASKLTARLAGGIALRRLQIAADVSLMAEQNLRVKQAHEEEQALRSQDERLFLAAEILLHRMRQVAEREKTEHDLAELAGSLRNGEVPHLAVLRKFARTRLQTRDNLNLQDSRAEEWWNGLNPGERDAITGPLREALEDTGLPPGVIGTVTEAAKYYAYQQANPHLRPDVYHEHNLRLHDIAAELKKLESDAGPQAQLELQLLQAEQESILAYQRAQTAQALFIAQSLRREAVQARVTGLLTQLQGDLQAHTQEAGRWKTDLSAIGATLSEANLAADVAAYFTGTPMVTQLLSELARRALPPVGDGRGTDSALRLAESSIQELRMDASRLRRAAQDWQAARRAGLPSGAAASAQRNVDIALYQAHDHLENIQIEALRHLRQLTRAPERQASVPGAIAQLARDIAELQREVARLGTRVQAVTARLGELQDKLAGLRANDSRVAPSLPTDRDFSLLEDLVRYVTELAGQLNRVAADFGIGGARCRQGLLGPDPNGIRPGIVEAARRIRGATRAVGDYAHSLEQIRAAAQEAFDHANALEPDAVRTASLDMHRQLGKLQWQLTRRRQAGDFVKAMAAIDRFMLPAAPGLADLLAMAGQDATAAAQTMPALQDALDALRDTAPLAQAATLRLAIERFVAEQNEIPQRHPHSKFYNPLHVGGAILQVWYPKLWRFEHARPAFVPREGEFGQPLLLRLLQHPLDLLWTAASLNRLSVRKFGHVEYLVSDAAGNVYRVVTTDHQVEMERTRWGDFWNEQQFLRTEFTLIKAPLFELVVAPIEHRTRLFAPAPSERWEWTKRTVTVSSVSAPNRWQHVIATTPRSLRPVPAVVTGDFLRFRIEAHALPLSALFPHLSHTILPLVPEDWLPKVYVNARFVVTKMFGSQHEADLFHHIRSVSDLIAFFATGPAEAENLKIEVSYTLMRIQGVPVEKLQQFLVSLLGGEVLDRTMPRFGEFKWAVSGAKAQAFVVWLFERFGGGVLSGGEALPVSKLALPSWATEVFQRPLTNVWEAWAMFSGRPGAGDPVLSRMTVERLQLNVLRNNVREALKQFPKGTPVIATNSSGYTGSILRSIGLLSNAVSKGRIGIDPVRFERIGELAVLADALADAMTRPVKAEGNRDAPTVLETMKAQLQALLEEMDRLLYAASPSPPPALSGVTPSGPNGGTQPPSQPVTSPAAFPNPAPAAPSAAQSPSTPPARPTPKPTSRIDPPDVHAHHGRPQRAEPPQETIDKVHRAISKARDLLSPEAGEAVSRGDFAAFATELDQLRDTTGGRYSRFFEALADDFRYRAEEAFSPQDELAFNDILASKLEEAEKTLPEMRSGAAQPGNGHQAAGASQRHPAGWADGSQPGGLPRFTIDHVRYLVRRAELGVSEELGEQLLSLAGKLDALAEGPGAVTAASLHSDFIGRLSADIRKLAKLGELDPEEDVFAGIRRKLRAAEATIKQDPRLAHRPPANSATSLVASLQGTVDEIAIAAGLGGDAWTGPEVGVAWKVKALARELENGLASVPKDEARVFAVDLAGELFDIAALAEKGEPDFVLRQVLPRALARFSREGRRLPTTAKISARNPQFRWIPDGLCQLAQHFRDGQPLGGLARPEPNATVSALEDAYFFRPGSQLSAWKDPAWARLSDRNLLERVFNPRDGAYITLQLGKTPQGWHQAVADGSHRAAELLKRAGLPGSSVTPDTPVYVRYLSTTPPARYVPGGPRAWRVMVTGLPLRSPTVPVPVPPSWAGKLGRVDPYPGLPDLEPLGPGALVQAEGVDPAAVTREGSPEFEGLWQALWDLHLKTGRKYAVVELLDGTFEIARGGKYGFILDSDSPRLRIWMHTHPHWLPASGPSADEVRYLGMSQDQESAFLIEPDFHPYRYSIYEACTGSLYLADIRTLMAIIGNLTAGRGGEDGVPIRKLIDTNSPRAGLPPEPTEALDPRSALSPEMINVLARRASALPRGDMMRSILVARLGDLFRDILYGGDQWPVADSLGAMFDVLRQLHDQVAAQVTATPP